MRKHTEDLPCKVPFCKECLANIKGLANTAKDIMTNPKQAPIETDIDNFLQHAESEFCIANYHGSRDLLTNPVPRNPKDKDVMV